MVVIDDNRAVHDDIRKILNPSTGRREALEELAATLFNAPTGPPEDLGFEIDSAFQGVEGLEIVSRAIDAGRPHAMAFVDVRMPPGWDGIETVAKLWGISPDLQIVLCTAYSDYSWQEITRRIKVSHRLVILKKPFDSVEVLQLATALTEKWRLHQQVRQKEACLESQVMERTASLQQSEQRYQLLFNKNPLPLCVLDAETLAVLAANEMALTKHGYTAEQYLNLNLKDLQTPASMPELQEEMSRWQDEFSRTFLTQHRKSNGAVFDVEVIIRPLNFEGRRARLMLIHDISEKKALETQLWRSQRVEGIGTLAVGLAHDLNNILTPIMMSVDTLRSEMTPNEKEETLDCIELCVQRGADVIRQILAFGRGVCGERAAIRSSDLLIEMAKIIRETFPKDIEFALEAQPDLWPVMGDKTQLHQVLVNLCINARDAMPKGGRLVLSGQNFIVDNRFAARHAPIRMGPHVLIQVRDTGCGIEPALMEKIFEPFFTTKELGKGTGLGLSTLAGIVKSHDGCVWVESEVNRGTVFNVLLPVCLETVSDSMPKQFGSVRGRGETILLVDDELNILSMLQRSLRRYGYKIFAVGGAQQALEIFREHCDTIDLVVTDVNMPGVNGITLSNQIRAISPRMKIVVSSGLGKDLAGGALNQELQMAGADSFLAKPYSMEDLLTALNEVLRATENKSPAHSAATALPVHA
jgi:PAS domain S-box-containing protein